VTHELEIWRVVGEHLDVGESLERIAAIVERRLPIDAIVVRRFDWIHHRVDTVAVARTRAQGALPPARTELSAADAERLAAWCRKGGLSVGSSERPSAPLRALLPEGLDGATLYGPLASAQGPVGALLLVARAGKAFSAEHRAFAERLLEPLVVVLDNDRRLAELTRLREAVEADNRALLSRLDRQDITEAIVGSDAGLSEVMRRVEQVAPTDAPVLILGETGSGKEVIARAIHARSRRAQGAMVRVNCGAIPHELIDSELFGHERGSFTVAVAMRRGWFERADGGTLFLDEIGELSLAAQVRLLRVVQEGVLERVGGHRPLSVDVRIVAATHRDLSAMVAEGGFRKDLWYRIGVFPMHLPPLRERTSDIPALAAHFAVRAGRRLSGTPLAPTKDDLERLVAYPWPGNVRELAAVIERAAILGAGRRLEVAAALGTTAERPEANPAPAPAPAKPPTRAPAPPHSHIFPGDPVLPSLDAAMRQHIEDALRASLGRVEGPFGAAARLGINPHTLRGRMRKLGIDWRRFRAS
jgi:transcriptional regulator with GAF, ATPase, and Fis domain